MAVELSDGLDEIPDDPLMVFGTDARRVRRTCDDIDPLHGRRFHVLHIPGDDLRFSEYDAPLLPVSFDPGGEAQLTFSLCSQFVVLVDLYAVWRTVYGKMASWIKGKEAVVRSSCIAHAFYAPSSIVPEGIEQ